MKEPPDARNNADIVGFLVDSDRSQQDYHRKRPSKVRFSPMRSMFAALATLFLLAACGPGQPFTFNENTDETEETVDPNDPNTSVDSKFLFDRESGMTMNSVRYDAENDELVINNLPFDGPAGRYDHLRNLGRGAISSAVYENRQTATTGLIKHYAVFVRSEHINAFAALGDWNGYGYGGANVTRTEFSLPDDVEREYVFLGAYAGIRSFENRGGLEIVNGDVRILLDVDDFDPENGIQGAIVGSIYNRTATTPNGGALVDLPRMQLALVEFSSTDGVFTDGTATSYFPDRSVRDSGSFEGMLAGSQSDAIGAHILTRGPAHFQTVSFDRVEYEITSEDVIIPGIPGVIPDRVIPGVTTTGTYDAISPDDFDAIQAAVDRGLIVPRFTYNSSDLPDGAVVTGVSVETRDFTSDFSAQEVGVLVAER